jgi:arabinofuranan 3-O-arabinosyltransferase
MGLNPGGAGDNMLVVDAVRNLLDGVSPYREIRFLYLPSSIPFALIQAPFPDTVIRLASTIVVAALLLVGWWACLRLFDLGLRSWSALLPIGAAAYFAPSSSVMGSSSWTAFAAAASGLAILLMGRHKWLAAAVVIGISIAVKPMLMPVALIFILARQWRPFLVSAAIPFVASAIVLLFLPEPALFFTDTVPFLLNGQDYFTFDQDSSLPTMLARFGLPDLAIATARVLTAVLGISAAVLRWRVGDDHKLRVVEVFALLMTTTFLVATPAFRHYVMLILPALMASSMVRNAAARTIYFWVSIIMLANFFDLPFVDYPETTQPWQATKLMLWLIALFLLLVGVTVREIRRHRGEAEPFPDMPAAALARRNGTSPADGHQAESAGVRQGS